MVERTGGKIPQFQVEIDGIRRDSVASIRESVNTFSMSELMHTEEEELKEDEIQLEPGFSPFTGKAEAVFEDCEDLQTLLLWSEQINSVGGRFTMH